MSDMVKLKAAVALGMMDHEILGRDVAQTLATEMGIDDRSIPFYAIEHRPDLIKGAVFHDCTKVGQKRMAIGADELAVYCCEQLGLEFRRCFGRGTQLRVCAEALIAHFSKGIDPTELPQ